MTLVIPVKVIVLVVEVAASGDAVLGAVLLDAVILSYIAGGAACAAAGVTAVLVLVPVLLSLPLVLVLVLKLLAGLTGMVSSRSVTSTYHSLLICWCNCVVGILLQGCV